MENVIKQGYLRKSFPSDRGLSGLLERIDPNKWFVLLVRNGVPFLEYYDKEMDVFTAEPINSFNLSTCQKLAYTHIRNAQLHKFSVVLQERVLELAATDRANMLDWYNALESTLNTLGVLQKEDHEHVYSFCPAVVNFGAAAKKKEEMAKAEGENDEDVFATVGIAEEREKIKRKESLDKANEATSDNLVSDRTSTSVDVSSDYSGDFIDSDFWQKNKLPNKDVLCDGEASFRPIPAKRATFTEINNNKSSIKQNMNSSKVPLAGANGACSNTKVKSSLGSVRESDECSKGKNVEFEVVSLPPSKCEKKDSLCTGNSCQNSENENQNGPSRNENLYSVFPVPDKNCDSGLSSDILGQPDSDSASAKQSEWETFDNDSDSVFVRNKLRHSTGSSKTSQVPPSAAALMNRHSTNYNGTPPLPPRQDSLQRKYFTVTSKTKGFAQVCSALAETNGAPPVPPKRIDSMDKDSNPPPLPSRNLQRSSAPPNLPKRNGVEGAAASVRRPARQLSLKMQLDPSDKAFSVVSLKQSQIEILEEEMASLGINVQLPQKDCLGLALVDAYGSVWIAGWNQKDHPRLHSKFHVGDELKKVNDVSVFTAAMAHKHIKSANSSVNIFIQRLQHAKVLAIRRSAEGESLGFKREGGTGEIIYVDLNGLAGRNGLTSKAPCVFSQDLCNWFITEINSRPVSLFFKELEIEHRLNAVGKEITLVVQPSDFINEIKKGLKKMKNHKSFIVK